MENIILGAGVTGLSYAKFSRLENLILEKEEECGGYCRTIKKDGFIWDYSGHFFHFQDEKIKNMIMANISRESLNEVNKITKIFYKGSYIDFPFQKNIHQLPKEEFIDCIYDLFNRDEQKSRYRNDSFKSMVYTNYGASISEKFLIPYNEKLYACDLDFLDSGAMGRFFPTAQKEDIIKNFRHSRNNSYNDKFIYPKSGASEYIAGLVNSLDKSVKIKLNEKAIRIDINTKTVYTATSKYEYKNLISTLPFPMLLDLCGIDYDKGVYSYNKVLVLNLGFDSKGNDTKTSWLYFPEKEYIFYRVGYYDNILNTDRMSLYVEIGFNSQDPIDITDLLYATLIDLAKAKIINNEKLVSYSTIIMSPAYVHISKSSESDIILKKELLKQYNIYSIGRYGSWTYCSIEDNIKEAYKLTQQIE